MDIYGEYDALIICGAYEGNLEEIAKERRSAKPTVLQRASFWKSRKDFSHDYYCYNCAYLHPSHN
jgi:hypothetical protein